jgi:8-oxo-dGTP pyrophosphatase MutT (NUDIX family)
MTDDVARWQILGERHIYSDEWMQFVQVEVQAGAERFWHDLIRLQPVAVVVVLDAERRVLMLRRHRFAADVVGWELPGGICAPGESGRDTAIRETVEETGWRPAGNLELLARFHPLPGMIYSLQEIYLARGAERVGDPSDPMEAGEVAWVPLSDARRIIAEGTALGSGTLVGLLSVLAQPDTSNSALG